jgi:hypothetical protein
MTGAERLSIALREKFADIDQQIEHDRWWRRELIIILVKIAALAIFAVILCWSIL